MIQEVNFDELFKKYNEYWHLENKNPMLQIFAPKKDYVYKPEKRPDTLYEKWTNIEYLLKQKRKEMESTYYGGIAFPTVFADVGPDIFGTLLGCDITLGENTSWAVHNIDDFETYPEFKLDINSKWWAKIIEMTKAYVEDSKNGEYLVGIPDMHPGLDGLVSVRGPENLCLDLYDSPEQVIERLNSSFGIYKQTMEELYTLTTKYQKYNTHWMNVMNDKPWYNISCDFMCMVSDKMFDKFVLPGIEKELKLFDKTIFHLDGPGALTHLDKLLELKDLTGIQWVYGAGATTAKDWIDILKKIQAANKCIFIHAEAEDVDVLLSNLKPEGLLMTISANSEEEAKHIEKTYLK